MSSSPTELVEVVMPQMGVSVSEGTVAEWRKQVGDAIAYEEGICDITTDKIDTEVPSPAAGTLVEILVPVGETVEVGTVLGRIATGDAPPAEPRSQAGGGEAPPPAEAVAAAAEPVAPAPAPAGDGRAARYSPVVSRVAAAHGVDLSLVQGTGRGGRVTKKDVLAWAEGGGAGNGGAPAPEPPLHSDSPYRPEPPSSPVPQQAPSPAPQAAPPSPAGAYDPPAPQPLSRMRATIGEHMKRSLETAATCTTWTEADVTGLERARRESRLTALPYVAHATVATLRDFPLLNAWLDEQGHTVHERVNLGIAVSLGDDGLIVPVIHDAQDLSVTGLAARVRDLARRARSRQLTPDDVRGGTFTITNPGQFGAIMATPVINQPQVAILDLEAIVKRPVVVAGADGEDAIAVRSMTILGMSWDHRALDGALAAQFLTALRRRLEAIVP